VSLNWTSAAIGIAIGLILPFGAFWALMCHMARVIGAERREITRYQRFMGVVSMGLNSRHHAALLGRREFDGVACWYLAMRVDPDCLPPDVFVAGLQFVRHVEDGGPVPDWLRLLEEP